MVSSINSASARQSAGHSSQQGTQKSSQHSALYTGTVRHRRFSPRQHFFTYPMLMLLLDLDELPSLFRRRWYCSFNRFNFLSVYRSDYFQPERGELKRAVIDYVTEQFAEQGLPGPAIARISLLTQPRFLHFIFNPISVYYCFDVNEKLVAIMAEVTNTPWGNRHAYVLPVGESSSAVEYAPSVSSGHTFRFDKVFHVSPFNPMNMQYRWRITPPDEQLLVHIDALVTSATAAESRHFDATLRLQRQSIETGLGPALVRQPFFTVRVVAGIYWQAFRLWLKKTPVFNHPGNGGVKVVVRDSGNSLDAAVDKNEVASSAGGHQPNADVDSADEEVTDINAEADDVVLTHSPTVSRRRYR